MLETASMAEVLANKFEQIFENLCLQQVNLRKYEKILQYYKYNKILLEKIQVHLRISLQSSFHRR